MKTFKEYKESIIEYIDKNVEERPSIENPLGLTMKDLALRSDESWEKDYARYVQREEINTFLKNTWEETVKHQMIFDDNLAETYHEIKAEKYEQDSRDIKT